MRLFTPEIAWHQTLPIYSCDIQPSNQLIGSTVTLTASGQRREPLVELPLGDQSRSESLPQLASWWWSRLATAGGDNIVRLWRLTNNNLQATSGQHKSSRSSIAAATVENGKGKLQQQPGSDQVTFLASLRRHEKPVNVVRWSPKGDFLASGGDDRLVIIWAKQPSTSSNESITKPTTATSQPTRIDDEEEDDFEDIVVSSTGEEVPAEKWLPLHTLRRHLEDVYDLAWAPDCTALVSGSVDHSIIVWPLTLPDHSQSTAADAPEAAATSAPTPTAASGQCLIVRDHKHYVQGVAWDPLNSYVVSLSNDRSCRIYRAGTRSCLAHVAKWDKQRLFQDDSWKSFFRRPTFSPDGLLLVCPSGNLESAPFASGTAPSDSDEANVTGNSSNQPPTNNILPQHAAHLFQRFNFSRPLVSFPTGPRPVVSIRFCPQPFQLRSTGGPPSLLDLPYRWLFCLVLEDGVLFYDTQHSAPFAQASQLHYQALNDASWSSDGHLVVLCSTDGYCSFLQFAHGELGTRYQGSLGLDAATSGSRSTGDNQPATKSTTEPVASSSGVMSTTDQADACKPISPSQPMDVDLPKEIVDQPPQVDELLPDDKATPLPSAQPDLAPDDHVNEDDNSCEKSNKSAPEQKEIAKPQLARSVSSPVPHPLPARKRRVELTTLSSTSSASPSSQLAADSSTPPLDQQSQQDQVKKPQPVSSTNQYNRRRVSLVTLTRKVSRDVAGDGDSHQSSTSSSTTITGTNNSNIN